MSDVGWLFLTLCVYFVCKAVVCWKNGKGWED